MKRKIILVILFISMMLCVANLLEAKMFTAQQTLDTALKITNYQITDEYWVEVDTWLMKNKKRCDGAVACYSSYYKRIYLTDESTLYTVVHELWHHLFKDKMPMCGSYISEYAKKDKWEASAELYANIIMYPSYVKLRAVLDWCLAKQVIWMDKYLQHLKLINK